MDKDYDKIRQLFEESLPELSPDRSFIARIENGIQGVDMVKSSLMKYKKRNRITAILSGAAGFICGAILTLLYPIINFLIGEGVLKLTEISPESEVLITVLASGAVALISVGVSLGTYSILSQQSPTSKRPSPALHHFRD